MAWRERDASVIEEVRTRLAARRGGRVAVGVQRTGLAGAALAALKEPAAQAAQGPSGPLKPGSQRQSSRRPLCARENESSGQSSHGTVSSSSLAAAFLYVPPAQGWH